MVKEKWPLSMGKRRGQEKNERICEFDLERGGGVHCKGLKYSTRGVGGKMKCGGGGGSSPYVKKSEGAWITEEGNCKS